MNITCFFHRKINYVKLFSYVNRNAGHVVICSFYFFKCYRILNKLRYCFIVISLENAARLKYLEKMVTNCIPSEIKNRLNSGNASCNSIWSRLSSHPCETLKIKVGKTINLPSILHWYETWSITLKEKHMPSEFENRFLTSSFSRRTHFLELVTQYCTCRAMATVRIVVPEITKC